MRPRARVSFLRLRENRFAEAIWRIGRERVLEVCEGRARSVVRLRGIRGCRPHPQRTLRPERSRGNVGRRRALC